MKLLRLHIRNFRLHADTSIVFPDDGVLGLIGVNESGKSTILEAITWGLFGAKATRGTKAGIRWHGAAPRQTASVTLAFEIGGKEYTVERGETNAKVIQGGDILAEGTDPVNKYMPGLLGLTHEEFVSSFFIKQKDVARLAGMLPTERVAFIRSLMGMSKIDAALKACRVKKSALSAELDGLVRGLGPRLPLEDAHRDALTALGDAREAEQYALSVANLRESNHGEAQRALEDSTNRKQKHDNATRALGLGKTAVEAATLELEALAKKLAETEDAKAMVAAVDCELKAVPALQAQRDVLLIQKTTAAEVADNERRDATLLAHIADLGERIAAAEKDLEWFDPDAVGQAETRESEAASRFTEFRDARKASQSEWNAKRALYHGEAQRLLRNLSVIKDAGAEGACPTCARALGETYQDVVALLTRELEIAESKELEAETNASALQVPRMEERRADEESLACSVTLGVVRDAERRAEKTLALKTQNEGVLEQAKTQLTALRDRRAELPDVAYDEARHKNVETEIARLDALDRSTLRFRTLLAQEAETLDTIDRRKVMLRTAEDQVTEAFDELLALSFNLSEFSEAVMVAREAERMSTDAKVAKARAEEAMRGAQAMVRRGVDALYDWDSRSGHMTEVSCDHLNHEHTAARLADFRLAIASTIRPEMEELMSGFMALLTDGRHESVSLDEDFSATAYENGQPMEVISGGAEDMTALAMRLSLSQMIAERAGHPLSLLFMDEPFGSLDAVRRGNLMSLVRKLKAVFPQTVLISHVEETRDAVDHVVELEFVEAEGRAGVLA